MSECKNCKSKHLKSIIDFGKMPLANDFIKSENVRKFNLEIMFCEDCYLVQVKEYINHKIIFNDNYKYFSSYSKTIIDDGKEYFKKIINRLQLNKNTSIIEVASNDGYLLSIFKENGYNNLLGIEPTKSTADIAIKKGINTKVEFFTYKLAKSIQKADLLIANNVITHVPDINDFIAAIDYSLNDEGIATIEFQHLYQLIKNKYFELFYHEHFTYLSLLTAKSIFNSHGLIIFDAEELQSQGGSLRLYVMKISNKNYRVSKNVEKIIKKELDFKLDQFKTYSDLNIYAEQIKDNIKKHIKDNKAAGKKVICYGAPAKGTILLNYLNFSKNDIEYTVDKNSNKQNLLIPGTNIPIYPVDIIKKDKPDCIFILPWNIKEEIIEEHKYIKEWGGQFISYR